jgi:hypothetical protein
VKSGVPGETSKMGLLPNRRPHSRNPKRNVLRLLMAGAVPRNILAHSWDCGSSMRRLSILLGLLVLVLPARAATRVTVAQLEQFLTSRQASKESDGETADRLGAVQLTEQLTAQTFARIESETSLGPSTLAQLRLLATSSIFFAPPVAELPTREVPDQASQRNMINSAIEYVDGTLRRLPDFVAVRTTDSFENIPRQTGPKHTKPKAELHLVHESRREIAYRNGSEIVDSPSSNSGNSQSELSSAVAGLTTKGEFGPVLETVFSDSFKGSVVWSRWQTSEAGVPVAVFRYSVPKAASHYLVDFCCYQKSKHDPQSFQFRYTAGYHGELYLDPATGAVDRITLEAELTEDDPVMVSGTAVQYGRVSIGERNYICPVRGVAVSEVRNLVMEIADEVGPERLINEVRFSNYHKFESTMRILPDGPDANRQ